MVCVHCNAASNVYNLNSILPKPRKNNILIIIYQTQLHYDKTNICDAFANRSKTNKRSKKDFINYGKAVQRSEYGMDIKQKVKKKTTITQRPVFALSWTVLCCAVLCWVQTKIDRSKLKIYRIHTNKYT